MQQGSAEWKAIKAGKLSGSRFGAAMARHKRTGVPNKPRRDLVAELVEERRTGVLTSIEPNEYMAHGTRCEPIACALFEFTSGLDVEHVAWIPHPDLEYVGFSPDGLIGDDGMIETKSPALYPRHLRTVESGKCPDDYIAQVHGGMWVTGRKWCKFLSFWEETHELVEVHVERDDEYIAKLAAECADVWAEVNSMEKAV